MHIEPMDEKIYEGSADDGTFVIHQAIEQLIQHRVHYESHKEIMLWLLFFG
jgi:hypothetical protein